MHFLSLRNIKIWFESIRLSLIMAGVIGSFMTIIGFSLLEFFPQKSWHYRLLCLLAFLFVLVLIISICKSIMIRYFISIKIHGVTVHIKQGDIFKAEGKKIIPMNEYFDTIVDDEIVAKNSLHGIFINNYVKDIDDFKQKIDNINESYTSLKKYKKKSRTAYPIGRIIPYGDFFLLSFTEFNDKNEAHLTKSKYEDCLIRMWQEICRLYAQNPINLPLLASGQTRIDDWLSRTNFDLLKSLLNSLFISRVDIRQPITIILTKDVMKGINIYELKGVKYL